ncbi:RNA-guided endonuclease InsQ/TnpB family protein [aff. Roholtiella sp. LEGE 12411]|uniref:RNA-guided endonuclease InsQ/TnpB family protein n=1 Tax=aff. Roholtiella sp. LEGE 12411 TaxID=1828822 RepID=UPI001882776D|nr:RNA-guided endonuclease TnpB family protein [aff. Roholtiella sp. LEGE 12411]MBE9037893.1 transposase [aff. Roholtiella sp. LEGE 12411]
MLTNYVYRLRPNVTQSNKMSNWLDMLRSTYNWSLADRIDQYNQQFIQGDYCDLRARGEACPLTCFVSKNGASGEPWKDTKVNKDGKLKNPRRSAGDIQITGLPELKKARPWFGGIDSTVLQQNVKRLDAAYKNFFSARRCANEGRGFTKFKNRNNFTSFTYQMGVKVQGNKIYLPKLGWMRFFNSRVIPEGFTIKAATIRKRQDGWYVSIRIEDKTIPDYVSKPLDEVKSILGCDLGITKLVHLSDRYQIDNPRFSTNKKAQRTLKIRQRRISRKVKGSKNRQKSSIKLGRFHKKIADKRAAYQWDVANKIVSRKVDAIALEDLNISGMLKRCKIKTDEITGRFLKNGQSTKKGLNRAISDASWADLILKIEYLAEKQGKVVIKINPKHSSQECRNCGHIDKSNRDGEKFICTECGYHEHADIGAAKTIRDRGLEIVRGDSAKLGVNHQNAQKVSQCSTWGLPK